jgi:hypothetical protein
MSYDCQASQLMASRNISYTLHTSSYFRANRSTQQKCSQSVTCTPPQRTGTSPTIKPIDDPVNPCSRWYGRSPIASLLSCQLKLSLMKKDSVNSVIQAHQKIPLSKQRAVETYLRENTGTSIEKYAARVDRQLTQGCTGTPRLHIRSGWQNDGRWSGWTQHLKSPSVRGLEDVQRGSGGGRCTGYVLRINPDAYKSVGKNASHEERMRELVKEMDNIRDNWMMWLVQTSCRCLGVCTCITMATTGQWDV